MLCQKGLTLKRGEGILFFENKLCLRFKVNFVYCLEQTGMGKVVESVESRASSRRKLTEHRVELKKFYVFRTVHAMFSSRAHHVEYSVLTDNTGLELLMLFNHDFSDVQQDIYFFVSVL